MDTTLGAPLRPNKPMRPYLLSNLHLRGLKNHLLEANQGRPFVCMLCSPVGRRSMLRMQVSALFISNAISCLLPPHPPTQHPMLPAYTWWIGRSPILTKRLFSRFNISPCFFTCFFYSEYVFSGFSWGHSFTICYLEHRGPGKGFYHKELLLNSLLNLNVVSP